MTEEDRHDSSEPSPFDETQATPPGWVPTDVLPGGSGQDAGNGAGMRPDLPSRIGPYKILEEIGEGGMGVVVLAEQTEPVRRRVALKLIKPGMDSRSILARFESERQALALMSHPNIASVFDAGTTEQGHPYFAMELVHGSALTTYCDESRLSPRRRLELFMKVCDAVQHAHQKGVIHRDLKPSNILVAQIEDRSVPKIIDFGLAKAMGRSLTEKTLFTVSGLFVGTPAYMSPEQAGGAGQDMDIDTRTDVYSLGVLLYELLVGQLPFEFTGEIDAAAFEKIRRKIREDDPPKPSTRVTTAGEEFREAAALRSHNPSSLARRLHGDLDWITMKALEKERARRYSTAAELRNDIERHLRNEPVLAGPPGAVYRIRKFARRHAGGVLVAAGLLVGICAWAVSSWLLFLDAESARQVAEAKEKEARSAQSAEMAAREQAEDAERRAEEERDRVLRLADGKRLEQLVQEAGELWPARPDRLTAMNGWQVRARDLASRLPLHERTLATLGRDGTEEPGGEGEPVRVRFESTEMQWQYDTLAELVGDLTRFTDEDPRVGLVADVERRIDFASTVIKRSVDDHRELWDETVTAVARSPVYGGLELIPQPGLVPLGADPGSGLQEFVHLQTGEIPVRDGEGRLVLTPDTGLVFVLLPGGTFRMGAMPAGRKIKKGSPNCDAFAKPKEAPVREVTLDPFFLSKYEMSQGQWERVMGRNPSRHGPRNYGRHYNEDQNAHTSLNPVDSVSWHDCAEVLRRLGLVLPTEAQWEFGARGGTTTVWWTGSSPESIRDAANLADAYAKKRGGHTNWIYEEWLDDGQLVGATPGSFRANPFGLHQVIGNVSEWCRDGWASYRNPVKEGDGERQRADTRSRPIRGGSFMDSAERTRSAFREGINAHLALDHVGVRPARRLER